MVKVPALLTLPRLLRHMSATGEGMPPDAAVGLDAPDAAARPVLDAARAGDWQPAAFLLAEVRTAKDWYRRSGYNRSLADLALHHVGWLDDWAAAAPPEDPDLALVRAELAIRRAWEIRTADRARYVSQEQFRAFRTLLIDATPVLQAAADLNPGDPVPWRLFLAHATGLGAPRDVFDTHVAQGRGCDPYDLGLHSRAVQYLAAKWYGSHEEMFDFAESAAAAAPAGSLLRGLPLEAATEYAVDQDAGPGRGPVARSRIEAIVESGLALSAAYEPGDTRAAGFRNHLALALITSGRDAEALEVFRLIGAHARTFPWAYLGDAREVFLTMRTGVRAQVARSTPYFGGVVPVPRSPAPEETEAAAKAVALAAAGLPAVREAVLLTGTAMRLAPARGGRTFVETAPSAGPPARRKGIRRTLLGEGDLVRLARTFSRGEKWPVLVAARQGDDYTLTLYRDGRLLTAHIWSSTTGEAPAQEEAVRRATVLAEAYGVTDPRRVTAALRGVGDPRRHLDEGFAALGLPPLPPGFGDRPEPLAGLPGAQVVARRSVRGAIRETLASDSSASGGDLPPLT